MASISGDEDDEFDGCFSFSFDSKSAKVSQTHRANNKLIDQRKLKTAKKEPDNENSTELDQDDCSDEIRNFSQMHLHPDLMKGLIKYGLLHPSPVQRVSIPIALRAKDLCACAATGSGKTAAFFIPILERLFRKPKAHKSSSRVLILVPTRELAVQCFNFGKYFLPFAPVNINIALLAGGLSIESQKTELLSKPDVIVATPGRLIYHMEKTDGFSLKQIEILVLDEADRMLDEGFSKELEKILSNCPTNRQTSLFSATITDSIANMAKRHMNSPSMLFVNSNGSFVDGLAQEFVRIRRSDDIYRLSLLHAICVENGDRRCLVFLPTKELAKFFSSALVAIGLKAKDFHGNLSHSERFESLNSFKEGQVNFLVATDVAARGIDVKGVQIVLNYSMPTEYRTYVHRVGRTARFANEGRAITLVGDGRERKILRSIMKESNSTPQYHQVPHDLVEQSLKVVKKLHSEREDKVDNEL